VSRGIHIGFHHLGAGECARPRSPPSTRAPPAWAAVSPLQTRGPAGPGSPVRTSDRTAREAHRRGGSRAEALSPFHSRQGTRACTPPTSIEFPILHSPVQNDRLHRQSARRLFPIVLKSFLGARVPSAGTT
jgi:hypothetical protein